MVRPPTLVRQLVTRRSRLAAAAAARPRGWVLLVAVALAAAILALLAAGLARAQDSDHADPGAREKLIGTFKTKPLQAMPEAAAAPQPRSTPRVPPLDNRRKPTDQLDAERRGYLTGVLGASSSADETFRREAGDRVFFASGSPDLGSRARVVLAIQADWLKRHSLLRLTIEGHADDGGSPEQELRLSAERAEAVRDRLIAEGVEARRIAVVARGREQRVAPCADSVCSAQNRRAVTMVYASGSGERIGLGDPRGGARPPLAEPMRPVSLPPALPR